MVLAGGFIRYVYGFRFFFLYLNQLATAGVDPGVTEEAGPKLEMK